jgi:hypothetical protein
MDVDKLLKALDNENNEQLFHYTTKKLREMNFKILKELYLPAHVMTDFMNKLKHYRYIDEMNDLKYGFYLRWIPINNVKNIHLSKGGLFCEMKITDTGVAVVCKNFRGTHFQIKMDECLIFQKLSDQELVLLSALDHLAK